MYIVKLIYRFLKDGNNYKDGKHKIINPASKDR
jgi:hypothetical protein